MKALIGYKIPFSKLKLGTHHFDFKVDENFFKHFEDSLIHNSNLNVHLAFDKQPRMFVLDFEFKGTVQTVCDRCVENFDLPVEGTEQIIVKMREVPGEEEEIIFISDNDIDIDVAPIVYEVLHLNLPLKKACELTEAEKPSCGFDVTKYLPIDDISEDDNQNDIWSALKDLK